MARLRALSAEQVLRGAPAARGASTPQIELTPILDGRLITETAETAYKARRQPRVPLLVGSNSADTAGNRIKATTKDEFFARYGKWSAQAKAAYDPDGTTELATMVSRANDDFGQAEPARFCGHRAGSPQGAARCDAAEHRSREAVRSVGESQGPRRELEESPAPMAPGVSVAGMIRSGARLALQEHRDPIPRPVEREERGTLARIGFLTNQPRTFGISTRLDFWDRSA